MGGAFFTGLSGLVANSIGIETVGNNLANSNSIAYKVNNAFFEELITANSQTIKMGQGVIPARISETFTQGSIQQSQVATDMAVQGSGFFVVGDGVNAQFYTRAGNFQISPDGRLITNEGLFVLGYPSVDGAVNLNAEIQPIIFAPNAVLEPVPTTQIRFDANLNPETVVGDSFTTSITVFDSLGASHQVRVDFARTGTGTWDYTMTLPAVDTGGLDTDPPTVIDSGTLTFDGTGQITTVTTTNGTLSSSNDIQGLTISGFANGAQDVTFEWDLFNQFGDGNVTQFNEPSSTNRAFQNGSAAGTLSNIIVRTDGTIEGIFTNGNSSPLGQVALANFVSPEGLVKTTGSLYARTVNSGEPTIGVPGTGGRGVVRGNALESSNVDIAEEFVKLIVFQRAYQANSRLVITADEVVQEAIALKR